MPVLIRIYLKIILEYLKKCRFLLLKKLTKELVLYQEKKVNDKTVEIPLIYFDLKRIGKGYGNATMRFVEDWIKKNGVVLIKYSLIQSSQNITVGFIERWGMSKPAKVNVCFRI